ncbi:MAG: acyloxyacyl hydrolase [Pyrinomonadaceae bacterium]
MSRFCYWFFLCQILAFFIFTTSARAQNKIADQTEALTTVDSNAKVILPSQTEPKSYKLKRRTREFNFEVGYSPFEPTNFNGKKEFNTAGRKLGVIDFKIGRVIGTKRGVTYTYLFGFTPLVILLKNEVKNSDYISIQATPNIAPTKRETSYGAGITPANFRFAFFPNNRIKPYLQAGTGFLVFNQPIPIPESKRLQFTGDMGGGFMIHTSPDKAWFLGYKYYHISNGNRTRKIYNPGFNANVFYIGYSLF